MTSSFVRMRGDGRGDVFAINWPLRLSNISVVTLGKVVNLFRSFFFFFHNLPTGVKLVVV